MVDIGGRVNSIRMTTMDYGTIGSSAMESTQKLRFSFNRQLLPGGAKKDKTRPEEWVLKVIRVIIFL